jgi:hypothetical protein
MGLDLVRYFDDAERRNGATSSRRSASPRGALGGVQHAGAPSHTRSVLRRVRRGLAVLLQPHPPAAAQDRRDLDGLALRALGRVHIAVVDHLEQSSRLGPQADRPSRLRAA